MATLEKIRNRAGILVSVVIGLALLAFILGDLFRGGPDISSDQFEIAEINGVSIDYRNYEQRIEKAMKNAKQNAGENTLDEQTRLQVRRQVWEQMLQEYVMGEQLENAGVNVSTEELKDMVMGNNIHPQIKQIPIFQNEQTGRFDPSLVRRFLANLEQNPEARQTWMTFEQSLKQQRVNKKYYATIEGGLYVTDFQAKQTALEKQKKIDFKYITLPYTNLKTDDISISDEDLKTYYESHKKLFKQEKAVDIEYVTFPIEPTQQDIQSIKKDVADLIPELKKSEETAQFVTATSDKPYDPTYYKKGEYENPVIDSIMFSKEEGYVYGPYKNSNQFRIAKVAHKAERPDTIKVRHIALSPQKNQTPQEIQNIADSLIQLLENGADFAKLATKHSVDQETASKGGNLGWRNVEEIIYGESLLDAGKGEFVKMPSQNAIFIAEMLEKGKSVKQVQVAIIGRDIMPSENTRDKVYQKASTFAGKHRTVKKFNKGVQEKGITKKQANKLKTTDRKIAGLDNARSLIREAFNTEPDNMIVGRNSQSPIFEIGDNYVIGIVTEKYEEGYAPLENVKSTVKRAVTKEKKADKLKQKVNDALAKSNNIEALGETLGVEVKMSENVSFAGFSIPGLGIEPNVQGVAFVLNENEISAPIEGNNGVFVIQVTKIKKPSKNINIAREKNAIQRNYTSRVQREVFEALKESAEIEDNRIKFY